MDNDVMQTIREALEEKLLTLENHAAYIGETERVNRALAALPQMASEWTPTIKEDIGLCAAAVVLAYHRKTHDHILQDNETVDAARRVERWLGRR